MALVAHSLGFFGLLLILVTINAAAAEYSLQYKQQGNMLYPGINSVEEQLFANGNRKQIRQPPSVGVSTHVYGFDRCYNRSCFPPTDNLLIGRINKLTVSSTCGINQPEDYCVVSKHSEKKCSICDSRNEYHPDRHTIDQVLYRQCLYRRPGKVWWQSENGVENVQLQLDLESKMQLTYLTLEFKYIRPAAMLIEGSADFGKTWNVYRYFADDCASSFPGINTIPLQNSMDAICDSSYYKIIPKSNGQLTFGTFGIQNYFSPELKTHQLRVTNLRFNFTKFHPMANMQQAKFYSISKLDIRGTCFCNGHASDCLPIMPTDEDELNASTFFESLSGRCDCKHNTQGTNCEQCADGFYARQDRRINDWDVCQACECDPMGSIDNHCVSNGEIAGQCNCKAGFNGMKCNQLTDN